MSRVQTRGKQIAGLNLSTSTNQVSIKMFVLSPMYAYVECSANSCSFFGTTMGRYTSRHATECWITT